MKNILLKLATMVVSLLVSTWAYSQSVVTNTIKYNPGNYVVMPPDLYVNIDFFDANGNKILEANEKGEIQLIISNKGGFANDVMVKITPEKIYTGLSFGECEFLTSIDSDTESILRIPVSADITVLTDSVKLNIDISEPFGYDITAVMLLSTFEHRRAKMEVRGVAIVDAGRGLRALNNNPDGRVQRGEVVQAYITIQNTGQALAENVEYTIQSKDPNVFLLSDTGFDKEIQGKMKNLKIGEVAEVSVRLSANNNYEHEGEYLPIYISVRDRYSTDNIIAENVPIPLDQVPQELEVLTIDANFDKLLAMRKTEIYSTSDRISSKMQIRDISIAPVGEPLFTDAVAIAIGAEENGYDIAPAPYAARDAEIMSKYFKTSMGIDNVSLYTNKQVTKSKMSDIFDANGELVRAVTKGETDVFIFYSGHGMPDIGEDGKVDVYLFPYDARKDMLKERGYSLNRLYSNLNSLGAKSVTVILDACFSGSSRQSSAHAGISIGNTKGGIKIEVKDMGVRPWENNPNFRLFTSSSSDQTSLGFDQSQSGLFTYYLAIGLQGDADANDDGEITLKELSDFVSDNVSKTARQIRNGDQTPQLYGNSDLVLGKIK